MRKGQIQALILASFDVESAIEHLEHANLHAVVKELEAFRLFCYEILLSETRRSPGAAWAYREAGVPLWTAVGIVAGLKPDVVLDSAERLIMFCGAEPRRYASIDECKYVLRHAFKDKHRLSDEALRQVGEVLDRDPTHLLGTNPDWDTAFLWVTKRRHSEFMKTVVAHFGRWVAAHPDNRYHRIYENVMTEEGERNLAPNRRVVLAQIESRAQSAAVRDFLREYYEHLGEFHVHQKAV